MWDFIEWIDPHVHDDFGGVRSDLLSLRFVRDERVCSFVVILYTYSYIYTYILLYMFIYKYTYTYNVKCNIHYTLSGKNCNPWNNQNHGEL